MCLRDLWRAKPIEHDKAFSILIPALVVALVVFFSVFLYYDGDIQLMDIISFKPQARTPPVSSTAPPPVSLKVKMPISSKTQIPSQCDIYSGKWVHDDSYPLYPDGECPYMSGDFNCKINGRNVSDYTKWRWQRTHCKLPSSNQWNEPKEHKCNFEIEPIFNELYIDPYPERMIMVEKVLAKMKFPISLVNITRLSDFRKDAHPSVNTLRKMKKLTPEQRNNPDLYGDCSHWCFPGLPDIWNELLYGSLLVNGLFVSTSN
ncbi:hypothetical protein KI387_002217 [Taxus chinensis]|uniref:Trichome birefringence-like N-terminal domain-containing protein n=1 Tax=Taxus chinensis TaxID=29808 RepID=A0AA38LNG0_TAXCH|nr:hypothetical protein KI387_002217 [Taxus chinensis]